jgi:hypothetical protein
MAISEKEAYSSNSTNKVYIVHTVLTAQIKWSYLELLQLCLPIHIQGKISR